MQHTTLSMDFDVKEKNLADLVQLASQAHAGQTDKNGVAYIHHPVSVANNYHRLFGQDYAGIATALLHDTLEDTDLDSKDLNAYVPETVIYSISLLTKNKGTDYLEYIKNLIATGDKTAMRVKYCDLLHNTDPERGSTPPPHKAQLYQQALHLLREHVL